MLTDWLAFSGAEDTAIDGPFTEVVNSARAYAYADAAGIAWLEECDHCAAAHPSGETYLTPSTGSTAPWWNGDPDRNKFLGVVGLGIEGADNSTRTAKVQSTLGNPGGSIGAPYYGPRTLVLRGLAVAVDDCGLQSGIAWLQMRQLDTGDPCAPPSLNYYECCAGTMTNYRRQYRQARIIAGPEFLEMHRNMRSGGACATFEMTIVTGDPIEYGPSGPI